MSAKIIEFSKIQRKKEQRETNTKACRMKERKAVVDILFGSDAEIAQYTYKELKDEDWNFSNEDPKRAEVWDKINEIIEELAGEWFYQVKLQSEEHCLFSPKQLKFTKHRKAKIAHMVELLAQEIDCFEPLPPKSA